MICSCSAGILPAVGRASCPPRGSMPPSQSAGRWRYKRNSMTTSTQPSH